MVHGIKDGPRDHRLFTRFIDPDQAVGDLQNCVHFDLESPIVVSENALPVSQITVKMYMMFCLNHAGRSEWLIFGCIPQINRPVLVRYSLKSGKGYANVADEGVEFDARNYAKIINEKFIG